MENASKALIIAGAILLSIAIIGVGMYVFQIASGSTENIGLQSEQAAAYNAKFIRYEGTKTTSQVKAMLNLINNHNNTNKGEPIKQIYISIDGGVTGEDELVMTDSISSIINTIDYISKDTGKDIYNIEIGYSSIGLVKFINIETPY